MSRDRARITTGSFRASGGKSHSSLRPTRSVPLPSAYTISVALGSSDTIRTTRLAREGPGTTYFDLRAAGRLRAAAPVRGGFGRAG
ncbi:MAG TPA: hypothetical protein VEY07_07285, partial [Thermoplasmata archaeon]|nr:hypothetical protein [Thermoplasmata archaeon]